MRRELTCIVCPRGCSLQVELSGDNTKVIGNACPKGKKYAVAECLHPARIITSVVRVKNRVDTMVSVKTESPIPKENIFELMEIIRKKEVFAPVKIGDVIESSVFGTEIVATKEIK